MARSKGAVSHECRRSGARTKPSLALYTGALVTLETEARALENMQPSRGAGHEPHLARKCWLSSFASHLCAPRVPPAPRRSRCRRDPPHHLGRGYQRGNSSASDAVSAGHVTLRTVATCYSKGSRQVSLFTDAGGSGMCFLASQRCLALREPIERP